MPDATTAPPSPETPVKRGPGRPPKSSSPSEAHAKPPEGNRLALVEGVDRIKGAIAQMGKETWETIKRTICKAAVEKGATDYDIGLFVYKNLKIGNDPLSGRCYLLPFKNQDGTFSYSFVQGVELYTSRAQQSGDLVRFHGKEICQKDEFAIDDVASCKVVHRINTFPRGPVVGAWWVAQKRGQEPVLGLVFASDIPERLRSNPQWVSNPAGMYVKEAIKRPLRFMYPDAEIGDTPEEAVYASEGENQARISIDVPVVANPEPPKAVIEAVPSPVRATARPVLEAAPPKAEPVKAPAAPPAPAKEISQQVTPETQKAFVAALTKAAGRNDKGTLMKALKDLTNKGRSIELSEFEAKNHIDGLEQLGIEEVDGKWQYKALTPPAENGGEV